MGKLKTKTIVMNSADWHAMAEEAREMAVVILHDEATYANGRSARLTTAADMLRAARTFDGHANMIENGFESFTKAKVDVWDLADEGIPA